MTKHNIKIISEGMSQNTQVLVGPNDLKLDGVTKIVIHPISVDQIVTATLTFEQVQLDVKAEWDPDSE